MKKYLMIGFAAIAFASCSNHDFETMTQADIDQAKYDQKFIETFGQPSRSQTWGFGSGTRAFTRAASFTLPEYREINPIQKPTVPSTFKNTLAEAKAAGAKYAMDYQNYQKGDIIYIDTEYSTLNNPQNTEDLTIYVDGDVTYYGQTNQNGNGTVFCVTENSTLRLGKVENNLTVYLAPGATLDLTKGYEEVWWPEHEVNENSTPSFAFQNPNAAIYMSQGSHLNAYDLSLVNDVELLNDGGTIEANNLKLDEGCTLWNEGTIKVNNTLTLTNTSSALYNKEGMTIETANLDLINNDALLFNEGTVTATGDITLHNSDAEIVNYGTLTGASFSSAAGGKMDNEGTGVVTITGKTDLTNKNSMWTNDGHWTCGSLEVSGTDKTGENNFNNCYLTVNGEFYLNRGAFILGNEAGVVCESFKIDDTSGFYLGDKSVLNINGILTTEIINPEYGFFAYGDEYAVVKASGIETTTNDPQSINYYGNLLVAINPHLSADYYTAQSSVKFTKDGQNIATIPSSTCSPGYEGDDDDDDDDDVVYDLRVMGEDLSVNSASDFDFNDVVFDAKIDAGKTYIKLLAAGGTLPLKIGCDAEGNGGEEVHDKFGVSTTTMVNTASGQHNAKTPVEFTLNQTWSSIGNIPVYVYKSGEWQPLTAYQGMPASKFGCPVGTDWADERQNIDTKWDGSFTIWVGDETKSFWKEW